MINLCKYNDLLGKPNKGFHSQRIILFGNTLYNFALFDILGTIIAAYLISRYFNYNFILSLFILFLLGTFLHIIFCVETAFLRLFISF